MKLTLRPRSKDFHDHGHTLADHKPNVLAGVLRLQRIVRRPGGLAAVRGRSGRLPRRRRRRSTSSARRPAATGTRRPTSRRGPPKLESLRQIVLVSPIAHENLGRPELARRQAEQRKNLEALHRRDGGASPPSTRCPFVDLFTPVARSSCKAGDKKLTINGVHLNEHGDKLVGQVARRSSVRRAAVDQRQVDLDKAARPKSTRRTCSSSTTIAPSTASTSTAAARIRSASSTSRPSSPSSAR